MKMVVPRMIFFACCILSMAMTGNAQEDIIAEEQKISNLKITYKLNLPISENYQCEEYIPEQQDENTALLKNAKGDVCGTLYRLNENASSPDVLIPNFMNMRSYEVIRNDGKKFFFATANDEKERKEMLELVVKKNYDYISLHIFDCVFSSVIEKQPEIVVDELTYSRCKFVSKEKPSILPCKNLILISCEFPENFWGNFLKPERLTSLSIITCRPKLTDVDISKISKFKELNEFSSINSFSQKLQLKPLQDLSSLKTLELWESAAYIDLPSILQIQSLKKLGVTIDVQEKPEKFPENLQLEFYQKMDPTE